MEKIKSISEAYSMQPISLEINPKCLPENLRDNEPVEIKEEVIQTTENIRTSFYVGYNSKGKMIFKYLANACNVHYF